MTRGVLLPVSVHLPVEGDYSCVSNQLNAWTESTSILTLLITSEKKELQATIQAGGDVLAGELRHRFPEAKVG